jgi:DNA repair protein RecO (recombination protein O)
MLVKTRGVVLHQIKYTDSGVVVQAYTREYGRQSFLVKGMRSKKSGRHNALLQPMFILDLVLYYKESRSMQLLKEFSVAFLPAGIYSDFKKSSIGVFLCEFMASVLKEESSHSELFDFIEDSVKYLDSSKSGFTNFHIAFLIGLSSYLGFEPGIRADKEDKYFDLMNGTFVAMRPSHQEYADQDVSDILAGFFRTSYDRTGNIPLTGKQRNELLETMVRYYSVHLPGLKRINSLEVLKEIFG